MSRFLTKLDYLRQETLLGIRRGGWMNGAAVSTVTVLLFLLGVSLQASWQLGNLLTQFGSQLEVSAYLETGVSAETLRSTVTKFPEAANIRSVTKEEAWSRLSRDLNVSNLKEATQQLEGNPLVDELKVKARSSVQVAILAEKLKKLPGVEEVQFVDEAVLRMNQLSQGFNTVSVATISILTMTAIAVINSTIRLIVLARRQEIEIMQLVGVAQRSIYLPFLVQGVVLGTAGATIAWSSISAVETLIRKLFAQADFVQFLMGTGSTRSIETIVLPLILLSFGSLVGLVGSGFAVRQFAKRIEP